MPARRYLVAGRVQGVGFRDWTMRQARALGLDGWVRNRTDGAVEALASGTDEALAQFEAVLRRGPPLAVVDSVVAAPALPPTVPGFTRAPTHDP